jgi:hypothetical protein
VRRLGDRPAANETPLAVLGERTHNFFHEARTRRGLTGCERKRERCNAKRDGEVGAAPAHLLGDDVVAQGAQLGSAKLRREAARVEPLLVGAAEHVPEGGSLRDDGLRVHLVELAADRAQHLRGEAVDFGLQVAQVGGEILVELNVWFHADPPFACSHGERGRLAPSVPIDPPAACHPAR